MSQGLGISPKLSYRDLGGGSPGFSMWKEYISVCFLEIRDICPKIRLKKAYPQIKNKNRGGWRTARIDPSRRGGIDGFEITANGATRTRNGPKPSKKSKNGPKNRGDPRAPISLRLGLWYYIPIDGYSWVFMASFS